MTDCRLLSLIVVSMFVALSAWGQNPVVNPTFDTDVTGWTGTSNTVSAWSALDANSSATSGSAVVTNVSTTTNDAKGVRQCIDGITQGTVYRVYADSLLPSGQTETGHSSLLFQWFDSPGCFGTQLGLAVSPGTGGATFDTWSQDELTAEAPSGVQSVRIRLSVWKNEDSGSFDAHFDNVLMVQPIFEDDFESGDTSLWDDEFP